MRISSDQNDVGYQPPTATRKVTVRLNGIVQRDVITADEEQGMIHRFVRDRDGKVAIAADGEHFATEFVRGHVEIEGRQSPREKRSRGGRAKSPGLGGLDQPGPSEFTESSFKQKS